MMKSMTAYATGEASRNGVTVTVETRCVNSRHLDTAIRLPAAHAAREEAIRKMVSAVVARGRVEIRIGIKNEESGAVALDFNEDLADAYYQVLNRIRDRYGMPDPVRLDQLIRMGGIIETVEKSVDSSIVDDLLEKAVSACLNAVDRMRETEGRAIARDLASRIDRIEEYIAEIERRSDGLIEMYQKKLADRMRSLIGETVAIDEGRMTQEAAFMADRSDISEEITRAKSHLDQFRALMNAREPSGKPLNFLLQEFSREFTTMGAKAGNAWISHIIVSAKTEIEKIREQVQNIE